MENDEETRTIVKVEEEEETTTKTSTTTKKNKKDKKRKRNDAATNEIKKQRGSTKPVLTTVSVRRLMEAAAAKDDGQKKRYSEKAVELLKRYLEAYLSDSLEDAKVPFEFSGKVRMTGEHLRLVRCLKEGEKPFAQPNTARIVRFKKMYHQ